MSVMNASRSAPMFTNMRMLSTSWVARDMIWPVCTLSW